MSFMDLPAYSKLVSSTKWCMSEYVTMLCKSLMHIKKSSGPSTEPWGTPMFMGRVSDISLLIAVYRVLSARYVLNNFKGIPVLAWQDECHDQPYQMPSENQGRLHKLFFHHLLTFEFSQWC